MRHPEQIVRLEDLRAGAAYALVWHDSAQGRFFEVTRATFAGTMPNSDIASAKRFLDMRGPVIPGQHYLTLHVHQITEYGLWVNHTLTAAPGFNFAGDPAHLLGQTDGLRMVVPLREWEAYPWPHEGTPSAPGAETWADEEAKLRRKRDAAMRRACGFD